MPYSIIALVAVVFLSVRHMLDTEASNHSKVIVVCLALLSLWAWFRFPRWDYLATLVQVGVSIYVLIYLRVTGSERIR